MENKEEEFIKSLNYVVVNKSVFNICNNILSSEKVSINLNHNYVNYLMVKFMKKSFISIDNFLYSLRNSDNNFVKKSIINHSIGCNEMFDIKDKRKHESYLSDLFGIDLYQIGFIPMYLNIDGLELKEKINKIKDYLFSLDIYKLLI